MALELPPIAAGGLEGIARPVAAGLREVERLLQAELSPPEPWMAELAGDLSQLGGKRLRPLLVLLWASATGGIRQSHLEVAAACELVHLATLVHDDILDDADVRRGQRTTHRRHGTRAAILCGDWLFTSAFRVAARSCPGTAVAALADAAREVCSGEVHQNWRAGHLDLGLAEYLEVVSAKTASLCAIACRMGPLLNGDPALVAARAEQYGRHLGIAFQMTDDCLDLVGNEDRVGKTLGTDLAGRKLTLPLIHLLATGAPPEVARLKDLLSRGSAQALPIQRLVTESGAVAEAKKIAAAELARAVESTACLAPGPARTSLVQLTDFVARRNN